ncbi:MAG TPA: VWA domain-containing protein [Pyrinomonadaceae bacterium]|nr:VWA domain-containing protein [Pyrinomonadaceae bacterium]
MPRSIFIARQTFQLLLVACCVLSSQISGQTQKPSQPQPDEVIRVNTELVQTDLTVVDKRGRFVDGLKAEQFELRVDAKPQPLIFFEQVAAGSSVEEKQLAAARTANKRAIASPDNKASLDRGRLIFFFVDDVHLTGESLTRARSLLSHFVADQMAANDRVAVVSTSGQIGFLQQLTDNKAVLREAIARLNYKFNPETTASGVSISEVDANLIASRGDKGLFSYLVEATMKEMQMGALSAMTLVKNRVRQINSQSRLVEIETLSRLESFIRSTEPLPGRKVVFFISDGFVMDNKRSGGVDVMQRVTTEAARVGAVVYTLDTRSNFFGASVDASRNEYPDFGSRTATRSLAESKTPQEPLETLADETGGRSYLNSNTLDDAVAEALRESSAYYLLAWRPDTENQKAGKSRIDVVIKDRPDLRVRMRRHFFELKSNQVGNTAKLEKAAAVRAEPEDDLRAAIGALYPHRGLGVSLSAGYLNTLDKAPLLSLALQIDAETLGFAGPEGKQEAVVDVLGVAIDDRGSFSSFKQKLKVSREAVFSKAQRYVIWNQTLPLPPGLYQVRVAVRDSQTGHTGGAIEWIELPRIEPGRFTMSSLFLTERLVSSGTSSNELGRTRANVDHRFARTSVLRFQTYVYNVARNPGALDNSPDVWIGAQIFRGEQQIMIVAPRRIPQDAAKDSWRLSYSAEIALDQLPAGSYSLQVTATHKPSGATSIQRINFSVE